MIFLYPFVLFLLIIPILLVYFRKKSSFISLEGVFSKEILEKILINKSSSKSRFYFGIITLVFMILALARPVMLDKNIESFYNYDSFNMVVLLDISKSMEANDIFPNRLEFAKKSLFELMDKLKGAKIASIAFTHDAFLVNPFSDDFDSIKFLIKNLNPNSLSSKGSDISSALKATKRAFESLKDEKKVVLLISDGADGRGIKKISKFVNDEDIILHVLNVGTKKGSALKDEGGELIKDKKGNIVISKRDDNIAKVASNSGGAFLALSGKIEKLDWLAKNIKNSAKIKKIKKKSTDNFKELFYYPLSLALITTFLLFNSIRLPFLALVIMSLHVTPAKASIFDFWDKYEAQKSYEKGDYKKAYEHFSKINKDEAIYDRANALYKQGKFKDALKEYEKIKSFKDENEFKRLYNEGNSYAKLNQIDKAINSYEKALKIKDDEDARYNLELLKKLKKKKNQQNKKQNNKENKNKKKNNQNKKDKDNKKNNQNKSDKNKKKDEKKKENKDNKNDKNKSKKNKQNSSNKTKKKEKKISEAEAKKWEKIMKKQNFTTRPMPLVKGDDNEISW
ncbi:vWA domain-containing protein [Sulfurospirillum sp. 1307]|jgi:Ca-activated chloride channel family protein